ncbi:MAG TPA: hypothetical protein VMH00_08070 [Candidatus Limnocylindrales bacterium]|nr:hypothetical protein [Candidatus Limnocylindrales bacterium]
MRWNDAKRNLRLAYGLVAVGAFVWFFLPRVYHEAGTKSRAYVALLVAAVTVFVVSIVYDSLRRWAETGHR